MERANAVPASASGSRPSRHSARGLVFQGKGLATFIFMLTLCGTVQAQLVVKTNNNGSVSQNSTLYIDATPAMPQLNLSVSGGALTCDSLWYTLDIDWTAASGQQTFVQVSGSFPCNQTNGIAWGSLYAGGTATLTWTDDCGDAGNLTFTILGTNPSPAIVDSFLPSTPWFWRNLLAWESAAWTASPTGIYHQFNSSGVPLNCNCPNGIGLTQLDPQAGGTFPSGANDFWAWNYNLVDGFNLLAGKRSAAYQSWSNELNDMLNTNGGQPVWPHWSSGVCTFDASPPSGAPAAGTYSFADGDWIKFYNGGFMIFWNPPLHPGTAGTWDINSDGDPTYVPKVCASPAI